MSITIHVKATNGDKFSLEQVDLSMSVSSFKGLVAQSYDAPADLQRLIFKGHVLKDEQTLQSYGLQDGHTVILVKGTRKRTVPPSPAPSGNIFASTAPTPTPTPTTTPPMGAQFSLGGSGNLGDMQRQMLENPEMMSEMINSPIMQSMLDNPELMQGMMLNNPQIRALMESNPELAHVMNDPNTIRQCLEMARNPQLMREMTRNTDRQMSNIEGHPEGFNALRRMYQEVQEPMNRAMAPQGDSGDTVISSDPNAQGDSPLPNPWAPRPQQPQQPQQQTMPNPMGQNPEALLQMMENPAMQAMMGQMFSNPDMLESIINSNPMARQMMDSNPAMRDMLRNPQFLQSMGDPNTLRAMLQLQGAMGNMQGAMGNMQGAMGNMQQPSFPQYQSHSQSPSGTTPPPNPYAAIFPSFPGAFEPPPQQQSASMRPEIIYREQLSSLNAMGFTDAEANLNALVQTGGNLEAAVDRLLQG